MKTNRIAHLISLMLLCLATAAFLSACSPNDSASNNHDHDHGHDGTHDHDHDGGQLPGSDSAGATSSTTAGKQSGTSDAEIIAAQVDSYPLKDCVVSDEPLGSMGGPLDYVHEGRLVRFCCKSCIKEFNKEPGSFLAKIEAARK